MPPELLTFAEAVADSDARGAPRSLLVGNGFSIECRPAVFGYSSLFDEADFHGLSRDRVALFDTLATRDFEHVVEHLRSAADLAALYSPRSRRLVDTLRADARVVRRGLSEVLARRHPADADQITDDEYAHARRFLAHFTTLFSVNYDLLLYWAVNREAPGSPDVPRRDGFEWRAKDEPGDLVWKRGAADRQQVFHLHGALHLFADRGGTLRKLKGAEHGPLVRQVRALLARGTYPLVVTEGTDREKAGRVAASPYLLHCHRRLAAAEGDLFAHGFSFSANDAHITDRVADPACRVSTLYVGLHVDPDGDDDADAVRRRAGRLRRARAHAGGVPLDVRCYDTATAAVWR